MSELYKQAGVDIDKGDAFIERIKGILKRYPVQSDRVHSGIGGFASLFKVHDRYLAAGSDGVGTKIKIAEALDDYSTIGQDLVAMCLNDIACTGARPLFFMDYLACDKLNEKRDCELIEGIAKACFESNCVLIGGETAEMPGCYPPGGIDLAGFGVGEVFENELIDGSQIAASQKIIGVSSNGPHSNGFSFIRKWFDSAETEWMKEAIRPTFLYSALVRELIEKSPQKVSGVAHITGGGIANLGRLIEKREDLVFSIDHLIDPDSVSPLFTELQKRSGASELEMYRVLNMGVGLILVSSSADELIEQVHQFARVKSLNIKAEILGEVKSKDPSEKERVRVETEKVRFSV